jgi:hypothetical protein
MSNFDDIGQCWIFTAHFLCRVLAAILKLADILKIWKRRISPLMVTYHYVKFYVSVIIHLEVININVRNFNLPIGFYISTHPLWTPQNMTLTRFTKKLKTLGPTRIIGSYTSRYWRSGISSTSVRNSVFSRVEEIPDLQ